MAAASAQEEEEEEEAVTGAPRRLPTLDIVPAWDHAPDGPGVGPRYVFRREGFGALVYDRETCQYLPFDDDSAALLLERQHRAAQPEGAEALAFVSSLQDEGLLDEDGVLEACPHDLLTADEDLDRHRSAEGRVGGLVDDAARPAAQLLPPGQVSTSVNTENGSMKKTVPATLIHACTRRDTRPYRTSTRTCAPCLSV